MSKERLLILDPEVNTQWPLKALLEEEGFIVMGAHSIDHAIKNIGENEINGLITEYRIDHSSSLNMVREFKRVFPKAYVMMLSNEEILENEYEEIFHAGTDDFFQKPISFRKVLLHLKKGLKQHANTPLEKESDAGPEVAVTDRAIQEGSKLSNIHPIV